MIEYLLEESAWPAALPAMHRERLRAALSGLERFPEILGVAAGGSFVSGHMDEYSDLDLVVVVAPGSFRTIEQRLDVARALGPLLAGFPGDHVGEPRLLICLYGPPPIHVDLKFVAANELGPRVEDPILLWDRAGDVRRGLRAGRADYPRPEWQWIEDRFWVWIHYAAAKIGRGELFEALDLLSFARGRVLGPLGLEEASARPNGVRLFERLAPATAGLLEATVARYDAVDIVRALGATVEMYRGLRLRCSPPGLLLRSGAETAAARYLNSIAAGEASARRKSVELLSRVDHLVYAAPDLDLAVEKLEQILGVRAAPAGRHPGRGTRNALIALGPASYLEVIGPDPGQPPPSEPRWFGIDGLGEERLLTWAAKGTDLDRLAAAGRSGGANLGEVGSGSRKRPDGVVLSWRYTDPAAMPADGIVPFFIDWGATPHPAATAPSGAILRDLSAEHPDVPGVRRMLHALGLELSVVPGPRPALVATIDCPRGRVRVR